MARGLSPPMISLTVNPALLATLAKVLCSNPKCQLDHQLDESESLAIKALLSETPTEARMEEPELCSRCNHPRDQHPWTATHHSGCEAVRCACPGFDPLDTFDQSVSDDQSDQ